MVVLDYSFEVSFDGFVRCLFRWAVAFLRCVDFIGADCFAFVVFFYVFGYVIGGAFFDFANGGASDGYAFIYVTFFAYGV